MSFVFNETANTETYTYGHTLSLHDALPILHHLAEAPDAEEHRDRRGRRRLPADDRLVCGHGRRRSAYAAALRAHLRVDAAALLGARAVSRRRLRQGQVAASHGGCRSPRHEATDNGLQSATRPPRRLAELGRAASRERGGQFG